MTDLSGLALDLAAAGVLLTAWGSLIRRRIDSLIALYSIQSTAISAVTFLLAYLSASAELYLIAGITVGVNVIWIPHLLRRARVDLAVTSETDSVLSARLSALAGFGLLLLSVFVVAPLVPFAAVPSAGLLPIAVTVILVGFLMIVTRRRALTQVLGLLTMANGVFLSGLAVTLGLGLALELGVAANLLVLAIVARLFLYRIHESFDTVDADTLRLLEG
ncbi:MAG: hypothetical protein AAFA34_01875 [Thermoplasmata archaeon]|jgi:hydrogenase-4 component E